MRQALPDYSGGVLAYRIAREANVDFTIFDDRRNLVVTFADNELRQARVRARARASSKSCSRVFLVKVAANSN